jgi:hypothetical protein
LVEDSEADKASLRVKVSDLEVSLYFFSIVN